MKTYFNHRAATNAADLALVESRKELIAELKEMVERSGTKVDKIFEHGDSLQINFVQDTEPFHNVILFNFNLDGTIDISYEGKAINDFSKTVCPVEGLRWVPSSLFETLDTDLVFLFKKDSFPLTRKLRKYKQEREEKK